QPTSRSVVQAATGRKRVVEAQAAAVANAAGCFNQAVLIARRQRAKSLELRAVMSVARLYQSQGRQKEARILLEEVHNPFTEGFDTMDLREAKALLDGLSR